MHSPTEFLKSSKEKRKKKSLSDFRSIEIIELLGYGVIERKSEM